MRVSAIAGAALAFLALTGAFSAAAGNGHVPASGVSWVIGPYACDPADIPNPGDTVTLFTPAAGMVVLDAFPNPRTFQPLTADGDPIMLVGQASELPDNYWALADSDLLNDMTTESALKRLYPKIGVLSVKTGEMFPLNEPIICENSPDGGTLTGGHVDWYFEVSNPAAL